MAIDTLGKRKSAASSRGGFRGGFVTTGSSGSGDALEATSQTILTAVNAINTKIGSPTGVSVSADIAAVKAETAAIVADTNELQTDITNGGRIDLLIDLIRADALLTRQILGNKHTVVESPAGTFTITVRNDADDATVRTIVYVAATGARTVS